MAGTISAIGLTKTYRPKVEALVNVSLEIRSGEVVALLGPNGAGKTTLLSILAGRMRPSMGSAAVAGFDVVYDALAVRRQVGMVPQGNTLDKGLTVFEGLYFHCRYFGMSRRAARTRAEDVCGRFGLDEIVARPSSALSGGQARRVVIARALATDPSVVFLDEPSVGLDPSARSLLWDQIAALRATGITIVLSTHYLHEAEALCDRIVFLSSGSVKFDGAMGSLASSTFQNTLCVVVEGKAAAVARELSTERGTVTGCTAQSLTIETKDVNSALGALLNASSRVGARIVNVSQLEGPLELLFKQQSDGLEAAKSI